MQNSPGSSSWQIFSDAGNHFRWKFCGREPKSISPAPKETLIIPQNSSRCPSLPSMSDLLIQGYPKLIQDCNDAPRLRTGSEKSVALKESSFQKALSVFGDGEIAERGIKKLSENCNDTPMFQTGSGKTVWVKESSIQKALSVLGDGEIAERGYTKLVEEVNENSPMFRTGSGKSQSVKWSSTRKAISIMGDGETVEKGSSKAQKYGNATSPMFQTGSGKPVTVKQSSIQKALLVIGEEEVKERDHEYNSYNSILCSVSSRGLLRAKTLLKLEENYSNCTSDGLEHTSKQLATVELSNRGCTLDFNRRRDPISGIVGIKNNGNLGVESGLNDCYLAKNQPKEDIFPNLLGPELCGSASKQPPIMFHTAGGRSVSVSSDALKRAKNLLSDFESEISPNEADFLKEDKTYYQNSLNKENVSYASFQHQNIVMNRHTEDIFQPSRGSFSNQRQPSCPGPFNCVDGMLEHINADDFVSGVTGRSKNTFPSMKKPPIDKPLGRALVDISNNTESSCKNQKPIACEKKRLGRSFKSSISSFKRPRRSQFLPPFNNNISYTTGSSSLSTSEQSCHRMRVSTQYPFQVTRKSIKEFFGGPPIHLNLIANLHEKVKYINADNAEKYVFHASQGQDGIGVGDLQHMLAQSGASLQIATKEWTANHYKWIVWKLACLERGYPASGRFLTVANVLEELKYRYEREVNHGHRSALKRILEGDALPSSMLVLCISAVHFYPDTKHEKVDHLMGLLEDTEKLNVSNKAENSQYTKIELTDGWYSINAHLDAALSKKLVERKLFIGQKLRIHRAGLCGWVAPVSPLEASETVGLLLHINGTYRAHWADHLGLCKGLGDPLAFRCIKAAGGPVPRTLVGVTRVYPLLFKERFEDGGSVVRSEKMEFKILQLYNQRRSTIAEGIISEPRKDLYIHSTNDNSDSEEGAKIFKLLETAAEPEVLMADMSSEQLNSFAIYQAKQEAVRQSDLQKKIEKALNDAGLSARNVTPLIRVRVVGLTSKSSRKMGPMREGLITIWDPTEKQLLDMMEGHIFCIGGLVPLKFEGNVLYLQARGSTTWKKLPPSAIKDFEPFFTPRKSILLANLGQVSLASEFDIAAVIVYVGEVCGSGHQKKQWVFVTDGSHSVSELQSEGSSNILLAISFRSPATNNDSFEPVGYNLLGSTVGFCNLIKRARDPVNHIWVAEATEISTYYLYNNLSSCSHLKEAAHTARKWAHDSSLTIQKLKERVLSIIGLHES